MSTINPTLGRLLAGIGGALLIGSLFMPWFGDGPDGETLNGWEFFSIGDGLLLVTGISGIAAAITGGRFGFFRPDLSFNGMTDILGVIASGLLGWFILFDFPAATTREIGVYVALAGAISIATGAGDFLVKAVFPKMPAAERSDETQR